LHITDQTGTDERRILFAPLRTPAWKNRGQLKTERTEETICVAPNAFSRKATNCKRTAGNNLRQQENREQKQNSKIPERQANFDSDSSAIADRNWPAGSGDRNRDSAGHAKSTCFAESPTAIDVTYLMLADRHCVQYHRNLS
jgi:hypothetical protein